MGIFLDFVWLTTRTPHGAYVRRARRNRIDRHGGEIERLALQATCGASGTTCTPATRRAFQQQHYAATYSRGRTGAVAWLAANTTSTGVPAGQPAAWDASPPEVFLAAVPADQGGPDAGAHTWSCDAAAFYGEHGPGAPVFDLKACSGSGGGGGGGALIVERRLQVAAGSRTVLYNVFGYAYSSAETASLLGGLQNAAAAAAARARLGTDWNASIIHLDVPARPSLGREILWHGGYVRQALTVYDLFGEAMLDQGSQYVQKKCGMMKRMRAIFLISLAHLLVRADKQAKPN